MRGRIEEGMIMFTRVWDNVRYDLCIYGIYEENPAIIIPFSK